MELYLRVLLTSATIAIALWVLLDAKEANFQPYKRTRMRLWMSGFAAGFSIGWLITGGTFLAFLWVKLLTGVILGFQWAFRLAGLLEYTSKSAEKQIDNNEEEGTLL